ncbi:MAG: penicillin-binding protein, partial [Bacteroidota bacterium]|nr:penicillin-binding protein [Bacteroidota bacterium]
DRSVHFTSSETGEGSHTALPIFGRFMEKVYADQKSGYTYGPFPKPWVKITKPYDCPSPRIKTDTAVTDSLFMPGDSTLIKPDTVKTDQ